MNIVKASHGGRGMAVTREELDAINALARRELEEKEVYLFSVRLCDNEVDREGERFSTATLEALAPLFVGKSGIFDHRWSARGQTARIYKTEVVRQEERLTQAGDPYCWLKGCAYMLRSPGNQELIDEIDAGIKKEVSVGCSVERKVCSICGADAGRDCCEHQPGQHYDGRLCYVSLEGAGDAYEFSFVAVPAQPAAGVVKGMETACASLKELVARHPACAKQLRDLEEQAGLGRAYAKALKEDVFRLGLLAGLGLEAGQLRAMAEALSGEQLEQLKTAYGRRAEERYPLRTQLRYEEKTRENRQRDAAFLV